MAALIRSAFLIVFVTGLVDSGHAVPMTQPQFRYQYKLTRDAKLDTWIVLLKNSRYVENVLDILDAQFKFPRQLQVQIKGCNAVNAFYSPRHGRITLCAELLAHFDALFRRGLTTHHPVCSSARGCPDLDERVRAWVLATSTFALWHEMGHAFVHEFRLPALGREEDVADQLSVYVANMGDSKNPNSALVKTLKGAVYWFGDKHTKHLKNKTFDWHGHHSLDAVRRTNVACWAIGKSPQILSKWAKTIPPRRRARCPKEWRKLKRAFDTLLKPHLFNKKTTKARFAANSAKRSTIAKTAQNLVKSCRGVAKRYARRLKQAKFKDKKIAKRLLKHFLHTCLMDVWTPANTSCAERAIGLEQVHRCLGLVQ